MSHRELPQPECELGYPLSQIEDILGDRILEFTFWMRGQTVALCGGRVYSYEEKKYMSSSCGPHGSVVYSHDLDAFLKGLPVTD